MMLLDLGGDQPGINSASPLPRLGQVTRPALEESRLFSDERGSVCPWEVLQLPVRCPLGARSEGSEYLTEPHR